MSLSNPVNYVFRYHNLDVIDPRLDINETVDVKGYPPGDRTQLNNERWMLEDAIKRFMRTKSELPRTFSFPAGDSRVDPTEPFYLPGIGRTFRGKASPDELCDVLRLAKLCGRIGPKAKCGSVSEYARQFFSIDCNALVGNFFNLSPEIKPASWASVNAAYVQGLSEEKQVKMGWLKAEVLSLSYLPLKPRRGAADIADNDVLITVNGAGEHCHIALVMEVFRNGDNLSFRIVEWGASGGFETHVTDTKQVKVMPDPKKKYGVGFAAGTGYRYFFARPKDAEPARWGRCGREDI